MTEILNKTYGYCAKNREKLNSLINIYSFFIEL